jgi:hypothetical protein
MLTKIDVQALPGLTNTISLPLQDVSAGYTVKDIEGLDPVKATIVSSPFAQLDGAQQQSARREPRNLVITVGLEPYSGGSTVKALRAALYANFMPKSWVRIRFYEDGAATPWAYIDGQVESFVAPLFAKDPEVVISIICFDPSFLDTNLTTLSGAGYSTVNAGGAEKTILYPGTVEVGYILRITTNRSLTGGLTIQNRKPDGTTDQLDLSMALSPTGTDVIVISTVSSNKYITVDGVSALYAVPVTSKWGPLYPGNNYFRLVAAGTPAISYTIEYRAKYGGM